jgi:hypothetical protein
MSTKEANVADVRSNDTSGKRYHQGQKDLQNDFDSVWGLLNASGQQPLVTPLGHRFTAFAAVTTGGAHQGERVIRIEKDGLEFARIYRCCWGHTTNCYGTRIGGYSEAVDSLAATTRHLQRNRTR